MRTYLEMSDSIQISIPLPTLNHPLQAKSLSLSRLFYLKNNKPSWMPYFVGNPCFSLDQQVAITLPYQGILNVVDACGRYILNAQMMMFLGTGKSHLLKEIIRKLRERSPKRVAVTASTGIAAVNIGGSTFHSFTGRF